MNDQQYGEEDQQQYQDYGHQNDEYESEQKVEETPYDPDKIGET